LKGYKKDIESLFQSYIDNTCSAEDIRTLLQYFNAGENEELLKEDLIRGQTEEINLTTAQEELLDATFRKIKQVIAIDNKTIPAPVVQLYTRFWFGVCAAVILTFIISMSTLYFFRHKSEHIVAQNTKIQQPVKDIAPAPIMQYLRSTMEPPLCLTARQMEHWQLFTLKLNTEFHENIISTLLSFFG